MADISKITVLNDAVYDIKDATARALLNGHRVGKDVPANAVFTDTTYEVKAAVSSGGAVSLVTTGEKYIWNNKGTYSLPSGGIPKTDLASAVQASLSAADTAVQSSEKGAAGGVAELDENGVVPSSQLPSYTDEILEYASKSAFPETGTTGKIYYALDTALSWRWSGSTYVEISPSIALGETSSTAYRGDRGKTAYDDSQINKANIGDLTELETETQSSLVAAINELNDRLNMLVPANVAETLSYLGDGLDEDLGIYSVATLPETIIYLDIVT